MDINFRSSSEVWFEAEAKLLDQNDASFGIFVLHGGSLVAVFVDGLVVGSEIDVLYIIVCFPVIILKQGNIDRPLELGCRAGNFAVS